MSEYCKNCKELQREIEKAKEENTRLFSAGVESSEQLDILKRSIKSNFIRYWMNKGYELDKLIGDSKQLNKYKQALEEIKKIEQGEPFKYYSCDFELLHIISEAKGANVENT